MNVAKFVVLYILNLMLIQRIQGFYIGETFILTYEFLLYFLLYYKIII